MNTVKSHIWTIDKKSVFIFGLLFVVMFFVCQTSLAINLYEDKASQKITKKLKKDFKGGNLDAVKSLLEDHERLVEQWLELRQMQRKMKMLKNTRGLRRRPRAERDLASLKPEYEEAQKEFMEEWREVKQEYKEDLDELLNEKMEIRGEIRMDDPSDRERKKLREELQEINAEAEPFQQKVNALDLLTDAISKFTEKLNAASNFEYLGRAGNTAVGKILSRQFPDILELRKTIDDYDADIKRAQKKEEGRRVKRYIEKLKDGKKETIDELVDDIKDFKSDIQPRLNEVNDELEEITKSIQEDRQDGRTPRDRYIREKRRLSKRQKKLEELIKSLNAALPESEERPGN